MLYGITVTCCTDSLPVSGESITGPEGITRWAPGKVALNYIGLDVLRIAREVSQYSDDMLRYKEM